MSKPSTNIRVIPRLDVKGPNLIKGIGFEGWRVLGHPEVFARAYAEAGADEIVYVDCVASLFRRPMSTDIINKISREIDIPLTVVGGLRTLNDIQDALNAGADKVAINTGAIADPELIRQASDVFGAQCIAISIEAQLISRDHYECYTDYGRQRSGIEPVEWAKRAVDLGAGEVLLTAIHKEGRGKGYDHRLTRAISDAVDVPVVASGGAGNGAHLVQAVIDGGADAVSAASIFHYHQATPLDRRCMSYDSPDLRLGKPIDSGNIDFLNAGYGKFRDFQVEPMSMKQAKQALAEAGIPVRQIAVPEHNHNGG